MAFHGCAKNLAKTRIRGGKFDEFGKEVTIPSTVLFCAQMCGVQSIRTTKTPPRGGKTAKLSKENMKQYIFEQTKLQLTEEMCKQLDVYCEFLASENQKYNLTAITEPSQVWEKHFADSMLGAPFVPQNATLCDVGSGAGFPALPLKILRPDIDVTLVDSLEKRINFTSTLCQKMGIVGTFIHSRAEDFAKTHSECFDVATARAVAPLPILLEYTAQIVKVGGIVLAYKTDLQEVDLAKHASDVLGLKFVAHHNFTLPSGASRCLLVYKKVRPTPKQFPRGQNKPRKMPL